MTRERAISLLLGSAHPLPAETDSEWESVALMLDSDETLASWFAVQSPADEAVKSVLRTLPVPAPRPVLSSPFSRPGVTRRRWLGVASTGLAASLAAGWWALERPTHFAHADGSGDFAGFREDMARFADRLFRLTKKDSQFATLNQWLDQMQAARPNMEALPPSISGSTGKGCRVIEWGGQKVGLICFERADTSQVVHLFSVPTDALQGALPSPHEIKQTVTLHGRECTGIVVSSMTHVLVGSKPGVRVSDLV